MGKVHYQVVMTYYKLLRKLRSAGVQPTPQQLRSAADRLGGLYPMPMGTSLDKVELGGVSCGKIDYRNQDRGGLIMFIHGGGFAFGSTNTHRAAVARLCKSSGCIGFIPEYRLTPEHPYPDPLNDCVASYNAMVQRYPDRKVFLFGDSAGGNLAAETVLTVLKEGGRVPDKVVLMSPWLDLSPDSESVLKNRDEDSLFDKNDLIHYSRLYLGDTNPYDENLSPLKADLTSFPETLIQVAENELLYYDSVQFAERLEQAGAKVELKVESNLFHSWQLFPDFVPEAKKSLDEAAEFIRS